MRSDRTNSTRPADSIDRDGTPWRSRLLLLSVLPIAIGATLFATTASPSGSTRGRVKVPDLVRQTRITGVGVRTAVYLDRTRTTFDYATGTTTPYRRLVTEIRYPSVESTRTEQVNAPVLRSARPYPVIIFAEGYRARPDLYAMLLDAWVRAGYVVVSPLFPDTTYPATDPAIDAGYPYGNPEDDLTNEPADIDYVISRLKALATRPKNLLFRLVNTNAIILAGQSDGGALVEAYAFDTRFSVDRSPIRATAIFAGYEISADAGWYREPATDAIPALVVQSAGDTCNEPQLSVELYDHISGEKYFLKVDNASHLGPFTGTDPIAFDAVRDMSLRFFTHVLRPGRASAVAVVRAGGIAGISTASDASSVHEIPTPAGSPYCAPAY